MVLLLKLLEVRTSPAAGCYLRNIQDIFALKFFCQDGGFVVLELDGITSLQN